MRKILKIALITLLMIFIFYLLPVGIIFSIKGYDPNVWRDMLFADIATVVTVFIIIGVMVLVEKILNL